MSYLCWFWLHPVRPGIRHEEQGLTDVQHGQLRQAVQEWQLGIKDDPTYPGCHERLGDVAWQLGQMDQAQAAYQEASRLDPKNVPLLLKLTNAARRRGDTALADDTAHKATLLDPGSAEAEEQYGSLEAQQRHYLVALDALRHAHALKPDNGPYLVKLAATDMDMDDMPAAEKDLSDYARTHPNDAEAAYLMGVIFNLKPRTRENLLLALEDAQAARTGMPGDVRVYNLLGQLYLNLGRPGDALQAYQVGLHLAPTDEGILHGLVQGFTAVHDEAAAQFIADQLQAIHARHDRIDHLKHVLGFNHTDTMALLEMGRLQEEEGKPQLAQNYYVEAVHDAPTNPRTRPALAAFMRRTGRPQLAKQALRPDFIPPAIPLP